MKLDSTGLDLKGSLTVTGHFYAGKDKNGNYAVKFSKDLPNNNYTDYMYIAGWGIDFNSFYYNIKNSGWTADAFICPTGWNESDSNTKYRTTIAGYKATDKGSSGMYNYWGFKLGEHFGISTNGTLHCSSARIGTNPE
jgi:hypothetical protein